MYEKYVLFRKVQESVHARGADRRDGDYGDRCRHRFAEAAASGDATETQFGKKRFVDDGYQPRLIDIFTVSDSLKSFIPEVDVRSHNDKLSKPITKITIFLQFTKKTP